MPSPSTDMWDKHGAACFYFTRRRQFLIAEEALKMCVGGAPAKPKPAARLSHIAADVFIHPPPPSPIDSSRTDTGSVRGVLYDYLLLRGFQLCCMREGACRCHK